MKLPIASTTKDGILTNASQNMAGAKTFYNAAGSTVLGSYSDAGVWTLGATNGGQGHTINGNGLTIQNTGTAPVQAVLSINANTTGGAGQSAIFLYQNGSQSAGINVNANVGGLNFYSSGSPVIGSYNASGAWTFGPSGFTGSHTIRGNVAYSTSAANYSSNIGTLSTSAYWHKASINVATVALQGISGGTDGRVIVISNTGSQTGDIRNEDGGAAAADRIITGTNGNLSSWLVGGVVTLVYDGAASRWRVIAAYRTS